MKYIFTNKLKTGYCLENNNLDHIQIVDQLLHMYLCISAL